MNKSHFLSPLFFSLLLSSPPLPTSPPLPWPSICCLPRPVFGSRARLVFLDLRGLILAQRFAWRGSEREKGLFGIAACVCEQHVPSWICSVPATNYACLWVSTCVCVCVCVCIACQWGEICRYGTLVCESVMMHVCVCVCVGTWMQILGEVSSSSLPLRLPFIPMFSCLISIWL